eukprot:1855638-Rhodomonas_salina.1
MCGTGLAYGAMGAVPCTVLRERVCAICGTAIGCGAARCPYRGSCTEIGCGCTGKDQLSFVMERGDPSIEYCHMRAQYCHMLAQAHIA